MNESLQINNNGRNDLSLSGRTWFDRKLTYIESEKEYDLPPWALFFLQLGAYAISPPEQTGERRITGVAVPTRTFSAVFAAVGAVVQDLGEPDDQKTDDEYFEYLCSLPANTPLTFRELDKKGIERLKKGVFLTATEMSGQRMLKIQLEKASMADPKASGDTRYVPKNRVRDVSIPNLDDALHELPINQKGTKVTRPSNFASSVIGSKRIAGFESETKMSCLIVGVTSIFTGELTERNFLAAGKSEGTLSELLRVKQLLPQGSPYRSNIFATNSRRPPKYQGESCPGLVIFDGAAGFLKWRDNFLNSHWLVLLDETSPNFESGRDTLNNLYLQRTDSDPAVDDLPTLPSGTEMVLFQEARQ